MTRAGPMSSMASRSFARRAMPGPVRGLGLAPDGKTLYVGRGGSGEIRAFPIESAGSLGKSRVLGQLTKQPGKKPIIVDLAVDNRGLIHVLDGLGQQIEVF